MASDSAKGLTSTGQYRVTKGTSFQEATTVKQTQQKEVYEAQIPLDWCFGPVAHGGYLASLLSRTVEQYLQNLSNTKSTSIPDIPSSCNVTYLAPVLPGKAEIRIEARSVTRNSAYLIASLYQSKAGSKDSSQGASSPNLCTEATVHMTTTSSMNKTTLRKPMSSRRRILPDELFSRNAKGHHSPNHDSGMSFYKFKPGWECYFNAESADRSKMLNPHPQHGPSVFDVWWKLDHPITPHELSLLADLIGPVLFNYEDVRKTHWLSTKQMDVEVVRTLQKDHSGWEWLFCRMELVENAGDRFYCDVTIADENGDVVALARQSCIVRPFDLVGKRRGSDGDKKTKAQGKEKEKAML